MRPRKTVADESTHASDGARPRGRPRAEIDMDAVADAVAGLFVECGATAVSIVNAAQKLDVSRATLYRTVPNKEDLVGVLFERTTRQQSELLAAVAKAELPVRDKLVRLIELQVEAAVRMRGYMPVFFGGAGLPTDVFERWHSWSREYEETWTGCVKQAIAAGVLVAADAVTATRLILGMCMWVSRWYRPDEGIDTADIARAAVRLLLPLPLPRQRGEEPDVSE
jgi:AcrR family transcriptional regulator